MQKAEIMRKAEHVEIAASWTLVAWWLGWRLCRGIEVCQATWDGETQAEMTFDCRKL